MALVKMTLQQDYSVPNTCYRMYQSSIYKLINQHYIVVQLTLLYYNAQLLDKCGRYAYSS